MKGKIILPVLVIVLLMAVVPGGQKARAQRLIGNQEITWMTGSGMNTFSSSTQTGQTVILNEGRGMVDVLAITNDQTSNGINLALSRIITNKATMRLGPGFWAITSDLAIPANVNLKMEQGTGVTISDGKTLTILGTIEAGIHQVFDCSAGGKVAFKVGSLVNTAWFGGLADLVAGLSGNSHIKAILNEPETIFRDLTVPSYVTLQINRGLVLTIADSKILTISGSFEAGVYHVFTDQNTGLNGVAFGTTSVNMLYPEWWGAVGDCTTDDTVAVQAAFNAQYGIQQRSWQARAFGGSHSFPVVPVGFSPNRFYSCNPLTVKGLISMVGLGGDVFGAQPLIYSKSASADANLFTITPFNDDTSISLKCEGIAFAANLQPGQTRRYYFSSPNPYGGKKVSSNSLYWRRCRFGTTSASGSCIYLEYSSDVEIAHCIFDASGADEGVIRFKNGSDVRVHDNEFFDCQYGIVVDEHFVGTISGNIFRNMGVGACVALLNGRDTGTMEETTFLTFTGNSIDAKVATKDYNYGILIGGTLGKCHVTSVGNTWQNLHSVVADYTTTSPKVTFTSTGDIVGDNVDTFIDTHGNLAFMKYKISGLQGPLTALAAARTPSNADFWDGQIATDVCDGKFTTYMPVRTLTAFKDRKTFTTIPAADLAILGNLVGNSYVSCDVQLNVTMVAGGKVYTATITGIMDFFNGSAFNFSQTGVAGASQITGATLVPSAGTDANSFLLTATIKTTLTPENGFISFILSKFNDPVDESSFNEALVATIKAAP